MSVGPAGSSGVGGGGTFNKVAKFISTSAVGDSRISDDGTEIFANSGAGSFNAGDWNFTTNGTHIHLTDSAKLIEIQADGNGDNQTVTIGPSNVSLASSGAGGVGLAGLSVSGTTQLVGVTGVSLSPITDDTTDLGQSGVSFKQLFLSATITAGGTTGAQTINKSAGSVNIAAGQSSLVVTCDKCTANSIVLAVIATNDATAILRSVVPAAGSFTIRTTAAVTGETRVSFWVLNQ